MTVNEAHLLILEEADKQGSDYFPLPSVLRKFKTVTYSFLGLSLKNVEKNQTIADDIKSLALLKKLDLIPDPDESQCYIAGMPANYYTRLSISIKYNNGAVSRKPTIERFGEHNTNTSDPYKKGSQDYPLIQQMNDYFKVYPGSAVPEKVFLTYIKKPTFGQVNNENIVDLPDHVIEELCLRTAASLLKITGDPRGNDSEQTSLKFRNV